MPRTTSRAPTWGAWASVGHRGRTWHEKGRMRRSRRSISPSFENYGWKGRPQRSSGQDSEVPSSRYKPAPCLRSALSIWRADGYAAEPGLSRNNFQTQQPCQGRPRRAGCSDVVCIADSLLLTASRCTMCSMSLGRSEGATVLDSEEETVRALPQDRAGYSSAFGVSNVAPFVAAPVSLPSDLEWSWR